MARKNSPRIHWAWWLLGIVMLLVWQYWPQDTTPSASPPVSSTSAPGHPRGLIDTSTPSPTQSLPDVRLPAFLPAEAADTIALIQRGGPFPYRQDGSVFGNREGHLPSKPRGWYHEYTVDTPGLSHRGARRIITGGNPPQAWYYTSDHYDSFRPFQPAQASGALR